MHGYETSEENSHEVKVHFQSIADILETEMVGNREYSSTSSSLKKVENEPKDCHHQEGFKTVVWLSEATQKNNFGNISFSDPSPPPF